MQLYAKGIKFFIMKGIDRIVVFKNNHYLYMGWCNFQMVEPNNLSTHHRGHRIFFFFFLVTDLYKLWALVVHFTHSFSLAFFPFRFQLHLRGRCDSCSRLSEKEWESEIRGERRFYLFFLIRKILIIILFTYVYILKR